MRVDNDSNERVKKTAACMCVLERQLVMPKNAKKYSCVQKFISLL